MSILYAISVIVSFLIWMIADFANFCAFFIINTVVFLCHLMIRISFKKKSNRKTIGRKLCGFFSLVATPILTYHITEIIKSLEGNDTIGTLILCESLPVLWMIYDLFLSKAEQNRV